MFLEWEWGVRFGFCFVFGSGEVFFEGLWDVFVVLVLCPTNIHCFNGARLDKFPNVTVSSEGFFHALRTFTMEKGSA